MKKLGLIAALILGTVSVAYAQHHDEHGRPGPDRFHGGDFRRGPGFRGPGYVVPPAVSGRYFRGIWYAYGTAPCWQLQPTGVYVWVCG